MRVRGGRFLVPPMVAVLACIALSAPAGAAAATVVNGNFETGTLNGWSVHRITTFGNWFAYKGTKEAIANKRGTQPIQPPPQGTYAAIADQLNADTLILSQDVVLEPGATHFLSLLAYYDSYAPIAVPTPDTLSVDESALGGQANQQFRIDVMKPEAPLESVNPADILATVFRTRPGASGKLPPTQLVSDLSAFAGQTVRLRIAVAASEEVLAAGIDAVAITAKPPGSGGPGTGSNRFRLGKVKANRKNGTVTLSVQVPEAGLVTARSAGDGSTSGAGASKAKKAPKLIKSAQLRARAAGTVKLRLKPTPAALEILREKHKLRARVAVTFKPSGASATTASKAVVFKLAARPAPWR
jgi:hypothetical protein